MDRLISEQAVLNVINEAIRVGRFYCGKEQTINEIKAIPTAESQTGYWEKWKNYFNLRNAIAYSCSKCGTFVHEKTNFCPDCGCKMSEIPTGS